MQSLRAGDGIEEVVEKYKKMVFGIAYTYTKNAVDADDVFQNVFLTYFTKKISFHNEDHRKAWLIRTTINCSKKAICNTWRRKTIPLDEMNEAVFQFSSNEENLVFSALSKIPTKYRTVIYLFYFEDMSINEISEMLKIKAGTIKVQLTRGRDMLREMLKGDYFVE